jgi:hypothetical protein
MAIVSEERGPDYLYIGGVKFTFTFIRNFLSKYKPVKGSECVEWTAYRDKKGYGICRGPITRGGMCKAHRIIYWITRGPLMEDEHIEHECRNTSCGNPYHIIPASAYMNTALGNIDRDEELPEADDAVLEDLF